MPRQYLTEADLKTGMVVRIEDAGGGCLFNDRDYEIEVHSTGEIFVQCTMGDHHLDLDYYSKIYLPAPPSPLEQSIQDYIARERSNV